LPQHPLFWTEDGREIAFHEHHPDSNFDVWVFTLGREDGPRPVAQTRFFEGQGELSPEGEWLAYTSDRDGDGYRIYVRPVDASGGSIRISRDGGTEPAWSPDGGELYFTNAGKMMAVAIEQTKPELRYGKARVLFEGFLQGGGPRSYDVAPDGRFVVVTGNTDVAPRSVLVMVLDWFGELKRLVPTEHQGSVSVSHVFGPDHVVP
jgi:Tol biopolymer transport system component